MRAMIAIVACVALAACGETSDADAPAEAGSTTTAAEGPAPIAEEDEPVQQGALQLTPTGFVAGSEAFLYEAGRSEVEATLEALLGASTNRASNDECGAGPIASTDYPGGVTVNFQDGTLVGWLWRNAQDGDVPSPAEISVKGGRKLGDARAALESADGFEMFEDSTLGDEFQLGKDLFGFFEEGEVSMFYSGTQCFFR